MHGSLSRRIAIIQSPNIAGGTACFTTAFLGQRQDAVAAIIEIDPKKTAAERVRDNPCSPLIPGRNSCSLYRRAFWISPRQPSCSGTIRGVLMQYVKYGRTGLAVSRLCLGTATFGKQSDEAVSHRIMDRAADAGVNFIDTADAYPMSADQTLVGRSEEIVGRWLKGRRDRGLVAQTFA
jgi:hypothetical protein